LFKFALNKVHATHPTWPRHLSLLPILVRLIRRAAMIARDGVYCTVELTDSHVPKH